MMIKWNVIKNITKLTFINGLIEQIAKKEGNEQVDFLFEAVISNY